MPSVSVILSLENQENEKITEQKHFFHANHFVNCKNISEEILAPDKKPDK